MKDHPDTPGTRDRDGGYLTEARRPVAATSPNDLEAYVALFIALLMACAVALIVHEVVRPTGTPGETIDSIIMSLWHAGAAAICFTVVTAAVIQGTRLAVRRASHWLFKSSEEQDWTPEVRQGPVGRPPWPLRNRYRQWRKARERAGAINIHMSGSWPSAWPRSACWSSSLTPRLRQRAEGGLRSRQR